MFKKSLAVSLMGLFAGLGAGIPTPQDLPNYGGAGNRRSMKSGNTKHHNRHNVHNHKWDFVSRADAGYGWFRNRTTDQVLRKKIANPTGDHPNYERKLTPNAQLFFGLAKRDVNGLIVRV